MESLIANLVGKVRRTKLNGRDYIVAPASLIVPGVLNGSKGSLYYPPDEIAANHTAWNHVPLVVNHPSRMGENVAYSDLSTDERSKVTIGHIRRPSMNGKLSAELWFDVEATRNVDKRVLASLESGKPIELSTGLFTDNEEAPHGSHFNGKTYQYIARDYRPDHLAILPDQTGACSIHDGCGVLVNKEGQAMPTSNTDQPRHPAKGFFQGKPHNAAVRGFTDDGRGVTVTEPEDPDMMVEADEPDDHEKQAQAEGDEDQLGAGAGGKKVDEGIQNCSMERNDMYGNDPHQSSRDAASSSMDHPDMREHALAAMDASKGGDNATAAKSHVAAAKMHEKAATDSRKDKEHDQAFEHDRAAAMHRKAASMHSAVRNQAIIDNLDATHNAHSLDKTTDNRSTTTNQGDSSMAKTYSREKAVGLLTANCKCEEDKAAFNAMSDDTLQTLTVNAFKKKDEEDDEEEEDDEDAEYNSGTDHSFDDGPVQAGSEQAGGKGTKEEYTKNQAMKKWLASMPPEAQAVWNHAKERESQDKLSIVRRLVANVADPKIRNQLGNEFMGKTLPELNKLALLLPPVTNQGYQRQIYTDGQSYAGMAGGPEGQSFVDNAADDVLEDVVLNYADIAAENARNFRPAVQQTI